MIRKSKKVRFHQMHPVLIEHLFPIDEIMRELLQYCVITSANDGKHKRSSAHYTGRAIDLRTWTTDDSGMQINWPLRNAIVARLQDALGKKFDVIAETDHIHVEYDPKRPS